MYYFVMLSPAFVETDLRGHFLQNGRFELSEKAGYSVATRPSMEVTPYSITFYHKVWTEISKERIKKVEACNSVTSSSLLNHCYSSILW